MGGVGWYDSGVVLDFDFGWSDVNVGFLWLLGSIDDDLWYEG